MASSVTLPLNEKIILNNKIQRTTQLIILALLLSLLTYRLRLLQDHGFIWLLAFCCESWFTFNWFLVVNTKWNHTEYKTYPERLLNQMQELPPVDLFVTTADPVLEPPIITINTVLSLLALDYPANKLACYVSDDAASLLTFYSLVEASEFAKHWIPFCNKYHIKIRVPFQYFSNNNHEAWAVTSSDFQNDYRNVQEKYEQLCQKIEAAAKNSMQFDISDELFSPFSGIDRRNHQSIIKVISENNDNVFDGMPHLVYVSREKRPRYPHHYKAGAMNVLTRVSGVMTNSPVMLNVDCDMFANNPQILLHAMCILLNSENEEEIAFVQCPQKFYGCLKDDPFGNEMVVLQEYVTRGMGGIQGPVYAGTGCFHRRKVIYGLFPNSKKIQLQSANKFNGSFEQHGESSFGCCAEFVKSASEMLLGVNEKTTCPSDISSSLEAAIQAADCNYESNTLWGTKIGWLYGSTTEDVLTGLGIHARGWKSAYLTPNTPAFLGCAPTGGPAVMTQWKRWTQGLLEVIVGKNSPIIATLKANLQFRQCLAYMYVNIWALRSIPELCYAGLPAYCLLTNTSFVPKASENAFLIPVSLLVIYNLYTLWEFRSCNLSIKTWWNNQKMRRIVISNAFLFGLLSVVLKLLGLSDTVFVLTRKDQGDDGTDADPSQFTFDNSSIFVPGTFLVLLHITALVMRLLAGELQVHGEHGADIGEIICSAWVLLSFLPFLKGLFRKGAHGIPIPTISKSVVLVGFFFYFCRSPLMNKT